MRRFCQFNYISGADGECGVAVTGAGNHGEGNLGHAVGTTKQAGDGVEWDEPVLHFLDAALPFGPTHECRPVGKGVPEPGISDILLCCTFYLHLPLTAIGVCAGTAKVDECHILLAWHDIGKMCGDIIRNSLVNILWGAYGTDAGNKEYGIIPIKTGIGLLQGHHVIYYVLL